MHVRKDWNGNPVLNGCFITLTYDDEHLPEDGSLNVKHFQDFVKRLRKDYPGFRYLHCGEYGPKTLRPHYHACLFGIDFYWDRVDFSRSAKSVIWNSETLASKWGQGFTTLAPLNFATASYTAGYVMKKLKASAHVEDRAVYGEGLQPISMPIQEYITMSRRPGLGTSWIEKYWPEVYPKDQVHIDGKTYRPPKFYDQWLSDHYPDIHHEVMTNRKEFLSEQGPSSDNALKARKSNFIARYAMKKQRLDQ